MPRAQQVDGSAPDHVIKFLEVRFADPPNWSCRHVSASSTSEEICLACTLTGTGSGDIVV